MQYIQIFLKLMTFFTQMIDKYAYLQYHCNIKIYIGIIISMQSRGGDSVEDYRHKS